MGNLSGLEILGVLAVLVALGAAFAIGGRWSTTRRNNPVHFTDVDQDGEPDAGNDKR